MLAGQGHKRHIAVLDAYGVGYVETGPLGVLLDGAGGLYHLVEAKGRAVGVGDLVGINFYQHIVDAGARYGGEDVLDGTYLGLAALYHRAAHRGENTLLAGLNTRRAVEVGADEHDARSGLRGEEADLHLPAGEERDA